VRRVADLGDGFGRPVIWPAGSRFFDSTTALPLLCVGDAGVCYDPSASWKAAKKCTGPARPPRCLWRAWKGWKDVRSGTLCGIRRAVMVDGLSRREAAKRFGVHRNTIRKMLQWPVPPGYRRLAMATLTGRVSM